MADDIIESEINDSEWLRIPAATPKPTPSLTPLVPRGGYVKPTSTPTISTYQNALNDQAKIEANKPRGGYVKPTSTPTIGVYQDALTKQANQSSVNQADFAANIASATQKAQAQQAAAANWQAALDDSLAKNLGTPAPTATPGPAAPVDTRTDAQKLDQFYAAYNAAIDKAIAGDPTDMKQLDRYFNKGVERPAIGYTPEYLQLERRAQAAGVSMDQQKANEVMAAGLPPEDPRNAAVNALGVSQDLKTKIIAENQAIKAGVRESDSVENLVNWFNAGGPPDPRTVAYTNSSPQNKIDVVNATNISQKAKVDVITEILSGNPDSVENMVTYHGVNGIGMQQSAANWASSANPENQIAVVNAANISQDFKNKVIAEIKAGSNTSDTVYDKIGWFERGNPPSAAALAILNPPAPAPVVVEPAPVFAPPVNSGTPTPPEPQETDGGTTTTGDDTTEDALASGNSEEHRQDEEAHAKAAAAQAEADVKQEQALAVATANKQSAKEERLKKIMEMRKPYMGGAASANSSSDAMVVPPIIPASQVPPPPFGGR